ncbi:sialidase family protein [Leifsonia sp. Root112D2]|uniref:sialidase family protein n=1 Tax=Leifsonia sp. Root112D2 TaxID=1736426 RepID=UPI0006FADADB|nr:sialidase family protein [Leifsonia sp. Root112D2]KQV07819.1 hypothetical protein ASC63_11570 [Leifsonia sp. Root112D2]
MNATAHSTQVLVKTGWPPQRAADVEHHIVYRNENEFAAWPYYCGLWKTADGSLVAGFKRVPSNYEDVNHYNLVHAPGEIVVIRSTDNGRTWDQDSIVSVFDMSIKEEKDFPGGEAADWSNLPPLDFTSRDTLVMGGGIPTLMGGGDHRAAWIRASTDGGRTWRAHNVLPNWDFPGVSMPGTSMYSVRDDGVMLFGVQAWAPGAQSPLLVVYASPDGVQFLHLGEIVEETPKSAYWPGGRFASAQHIYPRVVVLKDGRVLASVRYERDPRGVFWVEIHESLDGGRTWHWLSRVNDWGAPGDLVPMSDGRLVCVYGYRLQPNPGIRYRVSEDQGRTWGQEMILRDDGGSWDLGYPRVIEIEPGLLLTHYWINLKNDRIDVNGGVRHIACTIFTP